MHGAVTKSSFDLAGQLTVLAIEPSTGGRQVSGVVNEVRTTGRPTFVTHRGTPVVVLLPLDAEQLEDFVLANAPEYVASMSAADEAIERGEPGVALADAIAEFEAEHGPLDDES